MNTPKSTASTNAHKDSKADDVKTVIVPRQSSTDWWDVRTALDRWPFPNNDTRAVAGALMSYANGPAGSQDGKTGPLEEARPGVDNLMACTGLSRRPVQNKLKELRNDGWLVPVRNVKGGRVPTVYTITVPEHVRAHMDALRRGSLAGYDFTTGNYTEKQHSKTPQKLRGVASDAPGASLGAPQERPQQRTTYAVTCSSPAQENPVTPAAPPAGHGREIKEDEQNTPAPVIYGQGGYDADGTPWKSTILTAWLYWAHSTTDREAEDNLDVLLGLIGRRNGEQVADYARNYWTFSDSRAAAVALAGDEDDQRYAAGAEYKLLLHRAAQDPMHAVDVENPPADDSQQPLYVATREEVLGPLPEQPPADEQPEDVLEDEELTPAAQSAGLALLIAKQEADETARQQKAERDARYAARDAEQTQEEPSQESLRVLYSVPEPRHEPAGTPSSSQDDQPHPQAVNGPEKPASAPFRPVLDSSQSWAVVKPGEGRISA